MRLAVLAITLLAPLVRAQPTALRPADRARLGEAFHLAEAVRDSVWPGWSEVPFVLLLVTPEGEFLVRHPDPPDDFVSLGYDDLLGGEVYARPLSGQYPLTFLATFPAIGGVNTVVIGTPEHTGKPSTEWVVTALHEHFHQLQYTRPGYYDGVAALDLAGGDETGMWQLTYPYPYADTTVAARFRTYADALNRAVRLGDDAEAVAAYHAARTALRAAASEADDRYLAFQLWQEGVARYTEYAVAEAAQNGYEPLPAFLALPDAVPYDEALAALREKLADEMTSLNLTSWERVAVYPAGAAEALLLDQVRPGWKARYFAEPFDLARYHEEE